VASWADAAYDEGVEVSMSGGFTAPAGAVMLARVEACPADGLVYLDVVDASTGATTISFPCDPGRIAAGLLDENDELIAGESYVWLSGGGDFLVTFSVETETPTPLRVDVFTDPTPTVVDQQALLDGDQTSLHGVGDTLVYAFDGTAAEAVTFSATGLTEACALDAYGAPEVGSGELWVLSICGHTETPGGGLTNAGFAVPVVVFARTADPIEVTLAPSG
jgi:hypothetical protein